MYDTVHGMEWGVGGWAGDKTLRKLRDTLLEAAVGGQGLVGMGSAPVADLTCRWDLQEHNPVFLTTSFLYRLILRRMFWACEAVNLSK